MGEALTTPKDLIGKAENYQRTWKELLWGTQAEGMSNLIGGKKEVGNIQKKMRKGINQASVLDQIVAENS